MSQLLDDIIECYGSLDKPAWHTIAKRHEYGLYDSVEKSLQCLGEIHESTDVNDDFARVFQVKAKGIAFTARFSLVGPYACVHNEEGRFFSTHELISNNLGREIFHVINREGIHLLGPQELNERLVFSGERVKLYNVLFSDDGLVC